MFNKLLFLCVYDVVYDFVATFVKYLLCTFLLKAGTEINNFSVKHALIRRCIESPITNKQKAHICRCCYTRTNRHMAEAKTFILDPVAKDIVPAHAYQKDRHIGVVLTLFLFIHR